MVVARRLRKRSSLVVVVVATALAACGVQAVDDAGTGRNGGDARGADIGPTTSSTPLTTDAPPSAVEIVGDDGSELNEVAASAIADLDVYWGEQYPAVYGEEYDPIGGGFFAIDATTDPATLPCAVPDIELVLYNAYYCPPDDAIAWDQEGLMPDLASQYGDFSMAVVMAHEWGHAIQERAGVTEPTVVLELQADCFAGAWARYARDDDRSRFNVSVEELDLALAGILALRDAPGALASDPNAHGSGFDRVAAFQDGFEQTAEACAEYTDDTVSPYQFPFSDRGSATGGDLPLEEINTTAFESLEAYWDDVFPSVSDGGGWEPLEDPVEFTTADPPVCNGEEVTQFRLFFCVPDRFVAYDNAETMPDAHELGDFAVGTLYGTQYGLAVQEQLGGAPDDEVLATLRGDCYAGAWAGAILPEEVDQETFPYELLLSPGDLDEAVAVLLSFRSDSDRHRQGPGFERVRAFRIGVVDGPASCATVEPG
ncbi:neutral zinc metallopeptidase [soil metagenome]